MINRRDIAVDLGQTLRADDPFIHCCSRGSFRCLRGDSAAGISGCLPFFSFRPEHNQCLPNLRKTAARAASTAAMMTTPAIPHAVPVLTVTRNVLSTLVS